jgi:hypothetical protein
MLRSKIIAALALLTWMSAVLAADVHDKSLVRELEMPFKLYKVWKAEVEKEAADNGGKAPSRDRQKQIYAKVLADGVPDAPKAQAAEPKLKEPFTRLGAPGPDQITPNVGTAYPGHWVLMGWNPDTGDPKWIFVQDGKRRVFNW